MNTENYNSCTFPLNYIINKCKYSNNNNLLAHYLPITFRGKRDKVMTRGKMIFRPTGFGIQMTSEENYFWTL